MGGPVRGAAGRRIRGGDPGSDPDRPCRPGHSGVCPAAPVRRVRRAKPVILRADRTPLGELLVSLPPAPVPGVRHLPGYVVLEFLRTAAAERTGKPWPRHTPPGLTSSDRSC